MNIQSALFNFVTPRLASPATTSPRENDQQSSAIQDTSNDVDHRPRPAIERDNLSSFLNQKLHQSLNQEIGSRPVAEPGYIKNSGIQNVVGNILSVVAGRIAAEKTDGASEQSLRQLLSQAEAGIQKGLEDAKSTWQEMGLFNDEQGQEFEEVADKLHAGLHDIQRSLERHTTSNKAHHDRRSAAVATQSSHSIRSHSTDEQQFSLRLSTTEGDEVELTINRSESFESLNVSTEQINYQHRQQFSLSSNINVQVSGKISAEEQADISELLQDIDGLSNDFFSGDVTRAFEQAAQLRPDGTIANFDLNMSHRQLVVDEESIYRITQSPNTTIPDFLNNINDRAENHHGRFQNSPSELLKSQNVQNLTMDMLEQFIRQDRRVADVEQTLEPTLSLLRDFVSTKQNRSLQK